MLNSMTKDVMGDSQFWNGLFAILPRTADGLRCKAPAVDCSRPLKVPFQDYSLIQF